jgi:hypothetical protein
MRRIKKGSDLISFQSRWIGRAESPPPELYLEGIARHMRTVKEANLWFPKVRVDSRVQMRLFCFPYAGGGINVFRFWAANLPPQADVCLAQLPGRGHRIKESSYTNVPKLTKALAEGIRPSLNIPFAFVGLRLPPGISG